MKQIINEESSMCVNTKNSTVKLDKEINLKNETQIIKSSSNLIKRGIALYGNHFSYEKVKIADLRDKTIITCKKHGDVIMTGNYHIYNQGGFGCYICNKEKKDEKLRLKKEKEFFKKSISQFNNNYSYDKSEYKGFDHDIKLTCKKHKLDFVTTPRNHFSTQYGGCCDCNRTDPKISFGTFLKKAHNKHKNIYRYPRHKGTHLLNKVDDIQITCQNHGNFNLNIKKHITKGIGCPHCSKKQRNSPSITNEEFVLRSQNLYGESYTYDRCKFSGINENVILGCNVRDHGYFSVQSSKHLHRNQGCPKCSNHTPRLTTKQFIKRAKLIHGEYYDYNLVKYHDYYTPVDIICPMHGVFSQKPANHLSGNGCSNCKRSKEEVKIINYLKLHKIPFITQHKIDQDNVRMYCDFYLPNHNTIIEYDGFQHYLPVTFGGTKDTDIFDAIKKFKNILYRDELKDKYAKSNNLRIIRIPFWLTSAKVLKNINSKTLEDTCKAYTLNKNRKYFIENVDTLIQKIHSYKYIKEYFSIEDLKDYYEK